MHGGGDGERHPIEYDSYDNVCWLPNEELKVFKKAVLEDKKRFIFQKYTPSCRKALAGLAKQHDVLITSYGAGYLSADFPQLMGGITGNPGCYMSLTAHMVEKHPEMKSVAILATDDSYGIAIQWNIAAACEAYKDRIEVAFNKKFDPATTDFYPLVGSVLKQKPGAIIIGTLPPGNLANMLETGINLGYEGLWGHEAWDMNHMLKRISAEQVEGKLYAGYTVDASVPGFSVRMDNMYKTYCDRYGALDWVSLSGVTYSALCTWDVGFQAAESVDSDALRKTLYPMPVVDHPIYGKSKWGGKEIYGADHHLLTPVCIYVSRGGKQAFSGVSDIGAWWEKYKDDALPVLKKGGQTAV